MKTFVKTQIKTTPSISLTMASTASLVISTIALTVSWGLSALVFLPQPDFHIASHEQSTLGDIKILTLLIKTKVGPDPYPVSEAVKLLYGPFPSLNDWFKTVSHGRASISGDVKGWYTFPDLDYSENPFPNENLMWKSILPRLIADGIDVRKYKRVIVINHEGGLSSNFVGTIGVINEYPGDATPYHIPVAYAVAADDDWDSSTMILHELLHTFGLPEGMAIACADSKLISNYNCWPRSYGDYYIPMGGFGKGHLDAYKQEKFGWLDVTENINGSGGLLIKTSGEYIIRPIEDDAGIRFLKIPVDFDSNGNSVQFYYVELRQNKAYDSFFNPSGSSQSPYGGVLIHLAPWYDGLLIDTNPHTSPDNGQIDFNPWDNDPNPLFPNGTFTDPFRGISITLKSLNASGALIKVEYSTVPRDQAPTIAIKNLVEGQGIGGKVNFELESGDDRGIVALSVNVINSSASIVPIPRFQDGKHLIEFYKKYIWDTSSLRPGEYTLQAEAKDTSGRISQSRVRVNVLSGNPDTVYEIKIIEPAPGTIIAGGIRIKAESNLPRNTTVTLYVDTMPDRSNPKILISHIPKYSDSNLHEIGWFIRDGTGKYNIPIVGDGNYALYATAEGPRGETITSNLVSIGVALDKASLIPAREEFVRGDVNADSRVDGQDIFIIKGFAEGFKDSQDIACLDAADTNNDGTIDESDVSHLSSFLHGDNSRTLYPYPLPARDSGSSLSCDISKQPFTFTRGDVNQDRRLNISDAITILEYLFLSNSSAIECLDAADIDDDGRINIADAKILLKYLYETYPDRVWSPFFDQCGTDPSELDNLGCRQFLSCS